MIAVGWPGWFPMGAGHPRAGLATDDRSPTALLLFATLANAGENPASRRAHARTARKQEPGVAETREHDLGRHVRWRVLVPSVHYRALVQLHNGSETSGAPLTIGRRASLPRTSAPACGLVENAQCSNEFRRLQA